MRNFLVLIILTSSFPGFTQEKSNTDFDKVYSYVLQGDMNKALQFLDTLPRANLTNEQQEIKNRFYSRFRQLEPVEIETTDPVALEIFRIYENHWKNVLLDPPAAASYDSILKQDVYSFLDSHGYNRDTSTRSFTLDLRDFLLYKNYNSATGKTAGIFDLFLWSTEVPVTYSVNLPETSVNTTVVFLKDIITMGWQEYASLGKVYPGGWATREKLFAVEKAYDTLSENFKVSYLKHESQHFADYEKYPLLTGADLEYRAKLTELICAQGTLYRTLRTFIRNADGTTRNAHPFGNFAVIRDLSLRLFNKTFESDITIWEKLAPATIKAESEKLLKEHTARLAVAGPNKTTELIE